MSKKLRVVHYLNQFYGQYGGEEKAGMGIVIKEEAVGPGLEINKQMCDKGEIVATIICGDNFITENLEKVTAEVLEKIASYKPDLFFAGPGFNAGRYGLACAALTSAVRKNLKIPAVTGLYKEAPGTELYSSLCYIVETSNNARSMRDELKKMVSFALKLINKEDIDVEEGEARILGTGPIRDINYARSGPARAIDMVLAKYRGEKITTEVPMPKREVLPTSKLQKPLKEAKIAIVTDGGLVPAGNPDRMVPVNSIKYVHYSIQDVDALDPKNYEVSHQGYDNTFVLAQPDRLVPVDVMRKFEKEGIIGGLHDDYYTTAGVMTSEENGKKFGIGIANELKAAGVDAVILTST